MNEGKFKKGDIVTWFLLYDGYILKSKGSGIVVSSSKHTFFNPPSYSYRVYRNEFKDIMIFEEHEIENFKGD